MRNPEDASGETLGALGAGSCRVPAKTVEHAR
jgi:hypothetical protein